MSQANQNGSKQEGRILHQYFIDKTAQRYVFKNGKIAEFFGGVYRTEAPKEIEELDAEIAAGVGSIWKVKGQETINSLDLDPMAVLRKKIIAEYEAEKARSLNNGESFSDQSRAPIAGSNVAGVNAALAAKTIPAGSIKVNKANL